MGGEDLIKGVSYPSIANDNKAENLVLRKSFADNHLKLVNASLFHIKSVSSDKKFEVEEIDFATTAGNYLDWKGHRRNWKLTKVGQELKMIANGWEWEAYAPDGIYIDPE